MLLRNVGFTNGMEKVECVLTVIPADEVEPAMSLKSELYTPLVADHRAHLFRGEVLHIGTVGETGSAAYPVKRLFGLGGPAQLIECLGLHQQHIGKAKDSDTGGVGVVVGGDGERHKELADIVAGIGHVGLVVLTIEGWTTLVEDGLLHAQVALLIAVDKLLRGLVPAVDR